MFKQQYILIISLKRGRRKKSGSRAAFSQVTGDDDESDLAALNARVDGLDGVARILKHFP